jgi:hypothetical protein
VLVLLGIVLWAIAAAYIRWLPGSLANPTQGAIGFMISVPVGWLSVRLVRRLASLRHDELLAGVCLVGATAMMLDGLVLHWVPQVYGETPAVIRLGAAWLLWGYGVSFGIALLVLRMKAAG